MIRTLALSVALFAATSAAASPIAAGAEHSCAIAGGQLKCWGSNLNGVLGDGTTTKRATPVAVIGITSPSAVAGGQLHTCAIDAGQVKCWGGAPNSQLGGWLGDGRTSSSPTPVTVSGIAGATALAAGMEFTCAIEAGQVKCWGNNVNGQLGDGSTTSRSTPVPVTGIVNATAIAAGRSHACAIEAGQVKCWGSNVSGLGNGTKSNTNSTTPVTVTGISGATALAAGAFHTCAVAGGQVKCWGSNPDGELGDGTTRDRLTPVTAIGIGSATAITAGLRHACAIDGGQVKCWGDNSVGEIGIGAIDRINPQLTPIAVNGITNATSLAANEFGQHTCAAEAGQVKCWGNNAGGGVGGTTSPVPAPVLVSGLTGVVSETGTSTIAFSATLANCLFGWGESTYPSLFAPPAPPSSTLGVYYYRYYSRTNSYLGVGSSNNHLYYLGALSSNSILDLGDVASWYAKAGCR